ncbi:hypothetical protein [Nocardia noduli]|uniref:hypothetical protein n=1 Tax=Nocardia noduli TaxID=2815722 RepID=UPI001C238D9F|nr:hypothetical protein [Nocardia noduli]
MGRQPIPTDLSKAHTRTLAELSAAMDTHGRQIERCLDEYRVSTEGLDAGPAALIESPEDACRRGFARRISASAVRGLAAGGPVYAIPCLATSPVQADALERRLPTAMFDCLAVGNPLFVFGHPPIVGTGVRYRRVLGFYVHGMDRRDRIPCASTTLRSDLGLLFLGVELGARAGASDSELVQVTIPRTFELFTVDQAVQHTMVHVGGEASLLTALIVMALHVFTAGSRTIRHHDTASNDRWTRH